MIRAARHRLPATVVVAGAVLCALVVVVVLLACSGWTMFMITTASMSTTAPVGSLVVVHPEASYHVGQIISFHMEDRVVTHRIVKATAAGFMTKGDLNGSPDGWTVSRSAVIGAAAWIAPGLGWAVKAAPWLVLGVMITEAIARVAARHRDWRWATRLSLWALIVTAIELWLRPWFNVELLDFRPASRGGMLMHLVNTGLFPLAAASTRFDSGQDVVVRTTQRTAHGSYALTTTPSLTVVELALLILACLIPLAIALLVNSRGEEPDPEADAATTAGPARHRTLWAALIAIVIATATAVAFTLTLSTGAKFAASITNSTDIAGTNSAFTCQNAETTVGSGAYAIYALGASGAIFESDLSGNLRTGTYATTTTSAASFGCVRDTPQASVTFNGTSQCLFVPGSVSTPNTFTLEVWFRTSTTGNGKIIGFGDALNGSADGNYDRHIYLDTTGRLVFGVYPGSVQTIATPAGTNYADGNWHQVVATLSSAGMALYVDGALASTNTGVTTAQSYTGFWKIGCGNLNGWPSTFSSGTSSNYTAGPRFFTGQIQYAAIYTTALTAAQVRTHYLAGRQN